MIHFNEIKEPLSIEATCETCGEVEVCYLPTNVEESLIEENTNLSLENKKLREALQNFVEEGLDYPWQAKEVLGVIRYGTSWGVFWKEDAEGLRENGALEKKKDDIILF